LIPSTVLFIASDSIDVASQIRLVDGDSCPEFNRWRQLKRLGIVINFRRIQRVGFHVPYLGDYIINLSAFEEKSRTCDSDEIPNERDRRIEDEVFVFMQSKRHSENVSESDLEKEIENLVNLRYSCITVPIGFVFPIELGSR
jgi:hypothetical protein